MNVLISGYSQSLGTPCIFTLSARKRLVKSLGRLSLRHAEEDPVRHLQGLDCLSTHWLASLDSCLED